MIASYLSAAVNTLHLHYFIQGFGLNERWNAQIYFPQILAWNCVIDSLYKNIIESFFLIELMTTVWWWEIFKIQYF